MQTYRLIETGRRFLNGIYRRYQKKPVENKILFLSRQADTPSLDFVLLEEEIKRQHPDYTVVMRCRQDRGGLKSRGAYLLSMFDQMKEMATARAVILDSYSIPVSLLDHRPDLLVCQIWHSVGTMKKFGYSILDQAEGTSTGLARAMRMHHGYSYVFAAGEGYKDHLAEGFHFDRSRILTYPLPRLQCLQDPDYIGRKREEIFTRYPSLRPESGRINLVYVPTFRKNESNAFDNSLFAKGLEDLIQALDLSKYNLIIKAHPLADFHTDDPRLVCDRSFSSMEMLCVADAVISDYSCIIYEAAVLQKPIYLYAFDYDNYMKTRDLYIDYKKEMPGPVCTSAADLAQALSCEDYDYDRLSRFLKKYVEATGHEAENIVNFIFSAIGS